MSTNILRMPANHQQQPALNLPGPRIWKPKDLAGFFGYKVSWVYDQRRPGGEDPPPRMAGCGQLRFDTHSVEFQEWMRRRLKMVVDRGNGNE